MTAHQFLDALMVYCRLTDGSVTSYGRSWQHNLDVGGVGGSAHLFWLAADVKNTMSLLPAARADIARRLGLWLLVERDHDHLQPLTWEKS